MNQPPTESFDGLPVIVGSSFTGLLLSLQLSEAGVDHVLIGGGEPNDVPRLGESLNECASPELYGRFGHEVPHCFFTKSHISLLNGDFATQVHIATPTRTQRVTSRYTTARGPWPHGRPSMFWASITGRNLMHADRIELDKHVYRRAIAEPHCKLLQSLVNDVKTDGDAVASITLADGTVLERPKYVLDATGFRGVIAKPFKVGLKPLSNMQRVVWTHLHAPDVNALPQRWWRQGTNLLKLEHDLDGYDGIAWLIPLGEYVSIGVSVDDDRYPASTISKEEVIALLNKAYARRGVDYDVLFPEQRREIVEQRHAYFMRDRAYGANWMLVGGSYIGVWFPSSSGLWTVVAACRLLPHLFDRPQELGARYEEMLRPLIQFHEHLDQMIRGRPFQKHRDVYAFWSRWLSDVPVRLGRYLDLPHPQRGVLSPRFGFLGTFGRICRRFPTIQRLVWGHYVIRSTREPMRERQSQTFWGYFSAILFRAKNWWEGSVRIMTRS